jgi:hypothetical protein
VTEEHLDVDDRLETAQVITVIVIVGLHASH